MLCLLSHIIVHWHNISDLHFSTTGSLMPRIQIWKFTTIITPVKQSSLGTFDEALPPKSNDALFVGISHNARKAEKIYQNRKREIPNDDTSKEDLIRLNWRDLLEEKERISRTVEGNDAYLPAILEIELDKVRIVPAFDVLSYKRLKEIY